jgi:hypothetical protein
VRASGPHPHCGSEDHQLTSYERTSASVVMAIVVAVVCIHATSIYECEVCYILYEESIHVPLRVREIKYIVSWRSGVGSGASYGVGDLPYPLIWTMRVCIFCGDSCYKLHMVSTWA